MRILMANTLYEPFAQGGAERSVKITAEALHDAGHDVAVVSVYGGCEPRTEVRSGVRVHYVPSRNLFFPYQKLVAAWTQKVLAKVVWHTLNTFNPFMIGPLASVLAHEQPDVLHSNNVSGLSTALWWVAHRQGIPIVHTIRDYYLLCHRAQMFNAGTNCSGVCTHCKPFKSARVWATKYVTGVVGISQFVLDRHRTYGAFGAASFSRVIPNPYPSAQIAPPEEPAEQDSQRSLRIGFLGRLAPAKGIDVLLQATRNLSATGWEVHVGGTGDEAFVRDLKREHADPRIRFHGYVAPASFLPSLDVLVVPSLWHEPLGRVVFEAFAHGVPVIGARRGGIAELIDEGHTGWLFDPDAPGDLTDRLQHCMRHRDAVRAMRPKARKAAERFQTERIAQRYVQAYEDAQRNPVPAG